MKLISVDPSIRACGYGFWFDAGLLEGQTIKLNLKFRGPKSVRWIKKSDLMVATLWEKIERFVRRDWADTQLVIELPRHYSGGRGKAARNSGSILKLAWFIADLRRLAARSGMEVHVVPVSVWKGNLPKHITQKRMLRKLGLLGDHNMVDAVGLGVYWWERVLHRNVRNLVVPDDQIPTNRRQCIQCGKYRTYNRFKSRKTDVCLTCMKKNRG